MDVFYIIVLTTAVILLILLLTYIGIQMTKSAASGSITFPPKVSSCPDYWKPNDSDPSSCTIPYLKNENNYSNVNIGGLYDANGNLLLNAKNTYGFDSTNYSINFNDLGWTKGGNNANCTQKKWANQYGIVWDGVSNYNGC